MLHDELLPALGGELAFDSKPPRLLEIAYVARVQEIKTAVGHHHGLAVSMGVGDHLDELSSLTQDLPAPAQVVGRTAQLWDSVFSPDGARILIAYTDGTGADMAALRDHGCAL